MNLYETTSHMENEEINITVTKQNGEKALFDVRKLIRSLDNAGATEDDIESIIHKVASNLVDGISTRKVYRMAYEYLRKRSKRVAGRYRLKKAIFELGPTGYPFEQFVGALLKNQGYRIEVGKMVKGHCIEHEVDVVAEKDKRKYMIECKFHSDASRKSDVKVSLYIQARFHDIEREWKKHSKDHLQYHQGWIVTNTRFTDDAIQFGKCAGLNMISWDFPQKGSLRERIDLSGLHPVTALQSLTKREKKAILDQGIVLCRNLDSISLNKIGLRESKIKRVLKEAEDLSRVKN